MKVLVVLNENPADSHPDVYEAFTGLVSEGLIRSYDVYSHLLARTRGLTDVQIARELLESAGDAGHDLIIWMHRSRLEISDETLRAMKSLSINRQWCIGARLLSSVVQADSQTHGPHHALLLQGVRAVWGTASDMKWPVKPLSFRVGNDLVGDAQAGGQMVSVFDHPDIRGSEPHFVVGPEPASH